MVDVDERLREKFAQLATREVSDAEISTPSTVWASVSDGASGTDASPDRRGKRWPLAAAAAVFVLLVGSAAVLTSRSSDPVSVETPATESPSPDSSGQDRALPGTTVPSLERTTMTAVLPEGWHTSPSPYASYLTDPREIYTAASFPLPAPGAPAPACDSQMPSAPLNVMPADGVFVWLLLAGEDLERLDPNPGVTRPPLPNPFTLDALTETDCGGHPVRMAWFTVDGRTLGVYIALGDSVPANRIAETEALVQSIRFGSSETTTPLTPETDPSPQTTLPPGLPVPPPESAEDQKSGSTDAVGGR